MKPYRIRVTLYHQSVCAGFEIVPSEVEGHNIFDTLPEAKRYALNNTPTLHPSDVSYWRSNTRETTLLEVFDNHFAEIEDLKKQAYPESHTDEG